MIDTVTQAALKGFYEEVDHYRRIGCGDAGVCAVSAQNAAGTPTTASVFLKDGCYSCHGYDGHGGVGAKLAPKPIATAAFIAYVRHPGPGGMPSSLPK